MSCRRLMFAFFACGPSIYCCILLFFHALSEAWDRSEREKSVYRSLVYDLFAAF